MVGVSLYASGAAICRKTIYKFSNLERKKDPSTPSLLHLLALIWGCCLMMFDEHLLQYPWALAWPPPPLLQITLSQTTQQLLSSPSRHTLVRRAFSLIDVSWRIYQGCAAVATKESAPVTQGSCSPNTDAHLKLWHTCNNSDKCYWWITLESSSVTPLGWGKANYISC